MAGFNLGNLFATISLDSTKFEAGNARSQAALNRTRDSLGRFVANSRSSTSQASFSFGQFATKLRSQLNRAQAAINRFTSSIAGLARRVVSLPGLLAGAGIAAGLRSLVQSASNIDRVEVAFASLAAQVDGSFRATFDRLRAASQGTIDDFNLLQTANRALILGIGDTTEQMELLITAGRRLGQATGRNAREGFDDLATGIGRQSRLILDNLGLILSVSEAHRAYAKEIGVTVGALTEEQKRIAFVQFAYQALEDKLQTLGPEQDTFSLKLTRLIVSFRNAFQEISRNVIPALGNLFDVFERFNSQTNSADFFINAISDGITSAADGIARFIDTSGEGIAQFFSDTLERVRQFSTAVSATFQIIGIRIQQAFNSGDIFATLLRATTDVALIFGEIGTIAGKSLASNLAKEVALGLSFILKATIKAAAEITRTIASNIPGVPAIATSNLGNAEFERQAEERQAAIEAAFDIGADNVFNIDTNVGEINDLIRGLALGGERTKDLTRLAKEATAAVNALFTPLRQEVVPGSILDPAGTFAEIERQFNERNPIQGPQNEDRNQRRERELEEANAAARIAKIEQDRLKAERDRIDANAELRLRLLKVQEETQKKIDAKNRLEARKALDETNKRLNQIAGTVGSAFAESLRGGENVLTGLANGFAQNLDRAFGDTLAALGTQLTTVLSTSIDDAGNPVARGGFLGGLGGFLGSKAFAGILGLGASLLQRKENTDIRELPVEEIATSTSAVRGVVAGPQSVAIAEVGSSLREANRGVESLLRDILGAIRNQEGSLTTGGLGSAGLA